MRLDAIADHMIDQIERRASDSAFAMTIAALLAAAQIATLCITNFGTRGNIFSSEPANKHVIRLN
jgi:hypothetical protein